MTAIYLAQAALDPLGLRGRRICSVFWVLGDLEVPVVKTVTGDEVKYVGAVEMQVKLGYEIAGIHRGVPALVLIMDESMPT